MNQPLVPSTNRRAFSLIELVVVISIIAVIAAFTVPAVTSVLKGSSLTQASQLIVDQFSLARQSALSRNRSMEVRLYRYADPETPGEDKTQKETWKFRAMQTFEVFEAGTMAPIDKVQTFPNTIIMSYDSSSATLSDGAKSLSTIIDLQTKIDPATDNSATELPRDVKKDYEYVSFRFLPDGSTNLAPAGLPSKGNWFVTLHNINEKPTNSAGGPVPPANFFTVQVDPASGATKTFRPGLK